MVMALVGNKADLQETREVTVQVSVTLRNWLYLGIYVYRDSSSTNVTANTGNLLSLFPQDGIDYAEKNGMFFIETSAKTADNINQLFEVYMSDIRVMALF